MSRKERDRLTVMTGVKRQELTLVQAGELMAVCYRQSQRIWRRYQADGDAGLVHRLRGRPSARRQPPELRARALEQLGIELILANSPQAKGRVERMNGTLQDRLVKELRLAGINDIESGNRFLDGKYLQAFQRQFARAAASPVDVHRAVPRNWNEVLSWEEARVVQGDWTVACEGKRYQLDRQHEALSLVRRKVIVRTLRNGRVQLVYQGKALKWRTLPAGTMRKSPGTPPVRAEKRKPEGQTPALSHPWRRDGVGFGRKYWSGIKARGRAVRLEVRDSGRPPLRSGLPASRTSNQGNRTTNNNQPRGHSLVS